MGLKIIWVCGRFFLKGIRYKKISGKRGLGLLFFSWNDKRNMMRLLPCAENDEENRRNDNILEEIPALSRNYK
jgi:hypothetical protein